MIRRLSLWLPAICLVLQAQRLVPPADARSKIAAIFARYDSTSLPGCTVAASIDNAMVFAAAYGMADLEHHVALAIAPFRYLESATSRLAHFIDQIRSVYFRHFEVAIILHHGLLKMGYDAGDEIAWPAVPRRAEIGSLLCSVEEKRRPGALEVYRADLPWHPARAFQRLV